PDALLETLPFLLVAPQGLAIAAVERVESGLSPVTVPPGPRVIFGPSPRFVLRFIVGRRALIPSVNRILGTFKLALQLALPRLEGPNFLIERPDVAGELIVLSVPLLGVLQDVAQAKPFETLLFHEGLERSPRLSWNRLIAASGHGEQ